ncbi:oxygenase MpaB family protein [Streptomyces montanisoli]|uniref:DUF2236 domain-containing protein n=1 Tax=Streptomyces montanisoli TaxID=2798581 RepID=A0A940MFW9_9ACTN|nr:oxygenase MpaB family protein [Streptomyces montanisoli]MBP0460337.1 DUF2236 domain-containing protein [Streptomyces montanisoli]
MDTDIGGALRRRVGRELFARVAGPRGPENHSRIHDTPGPRWFAPDRPIRTVHADASMFVGGLRALFLQSLHPLAMAAVAAHSGYKGDPWGRLQRTSTFLAVTTFGTAADAEEAVAHVRDVHESVSGRAADGTPYRASDPHLLTWVHLAEVDSFLRAHARFGARRLTAREYDGYIADTARTARALGVPDPPLDRRQLAEGLAAHRAELRSTGESREAARFLLSEPPLPAAARVPYAALARGAVATLPRWTRGPLGLPALPGLEAPVAAAGADVVVRAIRWAMAAQGARDS